MYDAIIIGGGPAGSIAAKQLAERQKSVLLIEKCKLPRYKSCSGMLIKKTLDLINHYIGEPVPASVTCSPAENYGMVFTDDLGREYTFRQNGLNVWRSSFDQWLLEKAKQAGAVVKENTAAVDCEQNSEYVTVTLHGEKIYTEKAKYLIDCEGGIGVLKSKVLGSKPDFITTYQTFNKGKIDLDYHYFYAYLQPELSEYDAWFNVKDEMLVIGVSVKDTRKIPVFYKKFIQYLTEKHGLCIKEQLKEEKWIMPQIRPSFQIDYGSGRVFFAGEVAGFLNPMGEGISAGIESGYSIASAICDHFDAPDLILEKYQEDTCDLMGYMQRQWHLVGCMAGTFSGMKIEKE